MVRLASSALVLTAACSFSGTGTNSITDAAVDDSAPGAWLADYVRRKPIAIGGAGLTDVPICLLARGDAELAAHAKPDGSDLVVTGEDGLTVLATELVAYDANDGAVELWVRAPALGSSAYLYFDGPAATRTPELVWSARYKGVWHFTTSADALDSTSGNRDLVAANANASPQGIGSPTQRGGAYDGIDDSLATTDTASEPLDFPSASFSYSIWVSVTSSVGEYDAPIWNGGTSIPEPGYTMLLGHNDWGAKVHDGTRYVDATFGTEAGLGGRWVHLAAVVDRAAARLRTYTDGALVSDEDISMIASLQNSIGFHLGTSGAVRFRGALDEVRVYDEAIAPEWIAAEHANLADPAFVTLGTVETP